VVQQPYIAFAVDKSLGVNVDLAHLEPAQVENVLATVAKGGFQWVRQRFAWDLIEPVRGKNDWSVWDAIVDAADRHGLQLLAVLDGSPGWARAAEDAANPYAPPLESRDYGSFVAAVASRYGDIIDYYQVWDEPNIAPHWGARSVDPAAYTRLLREAAIQIRAADGRAFILVAALAPNVEAEGANMNELDYLDLLYQEGGREWFDVVAAQPYDFSGELSTAADPGTLNWRRVELLRQVMHKHGDSSTAIWAVAWGLAAATPPSLVEAVAQSRRDWPWLGPLLWAAWSPEQPHGEYALVGADGELGPLFEALRQVASEPPRAWPGSYAANHPSGSYEGDWRVTPSGADIGRTGDSLTVVFVGTQFDLAVRRGDYRAFLWATVDGQPASALPRDNQGRAYVVLYDPLKQEDVVTLARDLADGPHEAEIVAERGWGQWAIVGWASSRPQVRPVPWLSLALALSSISVASVVCYRAWPARYELIAAATIPVRWYQKLDDRLALAATAAAAVLLYIMTGVAPVLVVLLLLTGLLALRPEMGLPLIAVALPFYQPGRPVLGKVFSMVEILTLLTALGWLGHLAVRFQCRARGADHPSLLSRLRTWTRRLNLLDWGVVALVVVALLSLLWAEHRRVALREFRTVILEAAVYYTLLRAMLPAGQRTMQDERRLWQVVDAWVLGGVLISLVGVVQAVSGHNLITADGLSRVRGFYGSPNNLALYLGRVFPLTLAVLAWRQKGWRRWAYGVGAALMACVLFLTYSRGAWVIGVPLSLLFLAALRGRRALAATVLIMAVAALVIVLVVGQGRLASLLDTTEGTTYFRLQLWQSSWAMVKDHPILGVGLDNFLYYYRTHYVLPTAWEEFNLSHPHNFVLDGWLRIGLPGLVTLFLLLVGFFQRALCAFRRAPEGSDRILLQGVSAGMVYMVAHGLVDNAFFLVDLAFVFMLMLALVQAITATSNIHSESL
jgi:O-antigen ligase